MHGASTVGAGIESLSIGQLEDRLELITAFGQQLSDQRTVNRANMQVATESIGLELPERLQLASFTQHPSLTNYKEVAALVKREATALQEHLTLRTREALRVKLESIVKWIRMDMPPYEPQNKLLQLVRNYLHFFDLGSIAVDHPNNIVQAELAKISAATEEWQALNSLGQEVIEFDRLYQRAYSLWKPAQEALGLKLQLSSVADASSLTGSIEGFVAAAALAKHVEPEHLWSPMSLVEKTLEFMESFGGAIPYKLQEQVTSIELLLRELDDCEDGQDMQNQLIMANALDTYLMWCWRLEEARVQAVTSSIKICRAIGHIRELTA